MFPFLDRLDELPDRILLAGAGGGFDIYSGLPLLQWLRARGKEVVLANLSFASLTDSDAEEVFANTFKVLPETRGPRHYFPEQYLAEYLGEAVYGFRRGGIATLVRSYRWLVEHEGIEAIVVVDGGTDSLMRGDEPDLGTPAEDLSTLWAAASTGLPSLLAAIGFGIDRYHGVCHYYFLEAVAELTASGAFLGSLHLLPSTPGVELYDEACTFAFGRTSHPSIVSSHVLAAIHGDYGDIHPTPRTRGSEQWINPLMAMYWTFDLMPVVTRHMFLTQLAATESAAELAQEIEKCRALVEVRRWRELNA